MSHATEALADCHLTYQRGEPRSICGIDNAWPRVWCEVITEFIDGGWYLIVCRDCLRAIGRVPVA
jgi:hypothetical protein